MLSTCLQGPVTALTWFVTEECNLACFYCYLKRGTRASTPGVGKACVDYLLLHSGPEAQLHLRFFGGEPLLETGLLLEVSRYARHRCKAAGKEIRLDLVTNGTLLDEETQALLALAGLETIVSVDGLAETMQRNRSLGRRGENFETFQRQIRQAAALGIVRQLRVTIAPDRSNVKADLHFVAGLAAVPLLVTTAANLPWNEEEMKQAYEQVGDFLLEKVRMGAWPSLVETQTLLIAMVRQRNGLDTPPPWPFCLAGDRLLCVDVRGRLIPCHRLVQHSATLGWGTVWDEKPPGVALRQAFCPPSAPKFPLSVCSTCHAQAFCAGSCMAANWQETKQYHHPERRHCLALRAHLNMVERIIEHYDQEQWPVFTHWLQQHVDLNRD